MNLTINKYSFISPDWNEFHSSKKLVIEESHKPRKSEQQGRPLMWGSDYKLPADHVHNNFYDGGFDDNMNNNSG